MALLKYFLFIIIASVFSINLYTVREDSITAEETVLVDSVIVEKDLVVTEEALGENLSNLDQNDLMLWFSTNIYNILFTIGCSIFFFILGWLANRGNSRKIAEMAVNIPLRADIAEYSPKDIEYIKRFAIKLRKVAKTQLYAEEFFILGENEELQKNFEEAIIFYQKAIEKDPEYLYAYLYMGNAFHNLYNFDEAEKAYIKYINLAQKYTAWGYNNRGTLYQDHDDCENDERDKSLNDYNKAIELIPDNEKAYCNRGNLYQKLGKYKEALNDFTKAIELNPKFENAYYNRGNFFSENNEYEKALEDYTKVIKLNSEHDFAYADRAIIHTKLKKYSEAIHDYNKAIELNPKNPLLYQSRGLVYHELRRTDEAKADFRRYDELTKKERG